MRVWSSMLVFAASSATGEDPGDLVKIKNAAKRDSFNRLVTIATLINRHTVSSKGGDPDQCDKDGECTYGIPDNAARIRRINNARRINNVFFHNNLKRMYYKQDKHGDLKCAVHVKTRRGSRQRRSLTLDEDDWTNYCEMLEEAHEDEEGPCTDCCPQDEDGNWVFGQNERGIKTMGDFDQNDPEDFVKKTRKLYTVMKKWVDTYLFDCRGQLRRYTRITNFLGNRLFNGIEQKYTTIEAIEGGRWKRVFPKPPAGASPSLVAEYKDLNKNNMIQDLEDRLA